MNNATDLTTCAKEILELLEKNKIPVGCMDEVFAMVKVDVFANTIIRTSHEASTN